MSQPIEPNVISQALLQRCVEEQGPDGEAGRIARSEGIDFAEVTKLRLDFQNILHVENLWQFPNLRKLQLDNNIIETIEGLDALVHLEWLDLSFNNIEKIEGLDKLVNLRDLSLAHNRLTEINNLGSLSCLHVLSLGSNLIDDLEQVKYLRQFKGLQSLVLKGNPLASDEHYLHFVMAFVPSVVYLDFRMLLEEERGTAREVFQEPLEALEMEERAVARKAAEKREMEAQQQLYFDCYVDGLHGSLLYDSLFEEDTDRHRLCKLPGVEEMLVEYERQMEETCEHLTKVGLAEREKRVAELQVFRSSHGQACSANQQLSVQRVRAFEELKQKLLRGSSEPLPPTTHEEVGVAITSFHQDLMRLEMQLVEQLDEITKDFELNYSDMVGGFLEAMQSHMTQMRELENSHHERVTEIGLQHLERFVKNQLEEDLPDELRTLFVDKDTLVGAMNASHDAHTLAIDNKEDTLSSRAKRDLSSLLADLQQAELKRSRQKVVEIERYVHHQRQALESNQQH